ILILGVGNELLADEGFGVRALEYLKEHYIWPERVRHMDGGTLGAMLMTELMECDLVIVLDVVDGHKEPGTLYLLEGDALRQSLSFKNSMHQLDLPDTLLTCRLAGHPVEAMVFGMQPFDIQSTQYGLTASAQKKLPEFCHKVVETLRMKGIVEALPR
ncbi:MAG: HyaD/HybD family hydrogenase maturation endopeptidase, partial [Desulfovibrio sp.]|nr:HyaD/HybD family hydrogenase maturation endopeptidase [Desulfovibrio sp.]